jgi:hypothetical protein
MYQKVITVKSSSIDKGIIGFRIPGNRNLATFAILNGDSNLIWIWFLN